MLSRVLASWSATTSRRVSGSAFVRKPTTTLRGTYCRFAPDCVSVPALETRAPPADGASTAASSATPRGADQLPLPMLLPSSETTLTGLIRRYLDGFKACRLPSQLTHTRVGARRAPARSRASPLPEPSLRARARGL